MVRIKLTYLAASLSLFVLGLVSGFALSGPTSSQRAPLIKTLLENDKVLVRQVAYEIDSQRPTHVRQNDQVIVFLDDAHYEVIYPDGKKESRVRKAGEVIWHNRGEIAPNLTNTGAITYRTIVVDLK
jgi:hypothetical protein